MLHANIEYKNKTVVLSFPISKRVLAEHLAYIGVQTPASEIHCDPHAEIRVTVFGETDLGRAVSSLITPQNTVSGVNFFCEMLHELNCRHKEKILDDIVQNRIQSTWELISAISEIDHAYCNLYFWCPLKGYMAIDDFEDAECNNLTIYEHEINYAAMEEDAYDSTNLAEYFDGSNSATAKLDEIQFRVQSIQNTPGGTLYGRICVQTEGALTPEEIEEVREYIIGQCSDGWGEGFEQRGIKTKNGNLYVHFWHPGDDYFMLTTEEFERRIYGDRNDEE